MATLIYFLVITTCFTPKILAMKFNLAEIGLDNHLKDILIDGEGAYISKEGVQLTCENHTRAARATYAEPLHLWDAVSGEMADFTTNFSFVKDSRNASDGVSFFLSENTSLVTTSEAIGRHVMVSFVPFEFEKWWSNVSYGDKLTVMIRYDSRSQNYSVSYRGTIVANVYELHYKVDLRSMLPEWVVLGLRSCNQFRRTSVRSWSFNSTVLHDDTRWRKDEMKKGVLVFIMVVLLFATVIGLFCFVLIRKNHSRPIPPAAKSWAPREFSFKELSIATDNFDSSQMLGKGGFGEVYKATLANGEKAVVKKIPGTSQQCIKEYEAEVLIVGGTLHKHLVKLIGWCNEINKVLLVVYEFMENISLDVHLFNPLMNPLPWDTRYKIAHGLAKALRYLHDECGEHCILHRDIKTSNVLLDSNFEAKLGDFGLAKLNDHDRSLEISVLAGTRGYLAPECFQMGRASPKSDVYSYGVVALELATGRRCIDSSYQGDQMELVKWVEKMYRMKKIREIVDPRLDDYDDLQMKGLMALGLWCVRPDCNDRPLMREIVHALDITQDPLSDPHPKIPNFDSPLKSSPEIYLEIDLTEEVVVPSYPPLFMWPHFLFLSPLRFLLGSSWPRSLQDRQ